MGDTQASLEKAWLSPQDSREVCGSGQAGAGLEGLQARNHPPEPFRGSSQAPADLWGCGVWVSGDRSPSEHVSCASDSGNQTEGVAQRLSTHRGCKITEAPHFDPWAGSAECPRTHNWVPYGIEMAETLRLQQHPAASLSEKAQQCVPIKGEMLKRNSFIGSEVAQSCPTLCSPMDCSPPGSSIHGIFQARGLGWGAISFSRGSYPTYWRVHQSWEAISQSQKPLLKRMFAPKSLFQDLLLKASSSREGPANLILSCLCVTSVKGPHSSSPHFLRCKVEKTTEDEMVGWHHQPNSHGFEQALGVGDGQGSLVCCSPWCRKESDTTERLSWLKVDMIINNSRLMRCW